MLSHYRILWIMVFFDLPVTTKRERKLASGFRVNLLDMGFQMAQFSIYMKHCAGKEQADSLSKKLRFNVPEIGNVKILRITDKQFESIEHLGRNDASQIRYQQLGLF